MGRGDGGSNEAPPVLRRESEPERPALAPLPSARELMMELLPLLAWAQLQVVIALEVPESKRTERERAALRVLAELRSRLRELVITR